MTLEKVRYPSRALFGEGVRNPETQRRIQAAFKRGFQTRDAELTLGRMLGDLANQ